MPRGLPPGLTINPSTGVISGDPRTGGEYTFRVRAKDSTGQVAESEQVVFIFSLTLSGTLADAYQTEDYSGSVSAAGGTAPYTYAVVVGSLPTGITLSSAGVFSGTTDGAATSQTFTIETTDANGFRGRQ